MAYSDFNLSDVCHRLGLTVAVGGKLFAGVVEVDLPAALGEVEAMVGR